MQLHQEDAGQSREPWPVVSFSRLAGVYTRVQAVINGGIITMASLLANSLSE